MASLLNYIYDYYDSGYEHGNILFKVHRAIVRSRLVVRLVFGMRVRKNPHPGGYFDVTALLLRKELRRQSRNYLYPRLLEIGAGPFALLSGWMSRRVRQRIVACDYDTSTVASAREHVEDNVFNVELIRSDILSAIPVNEYDLIFWRLPPHADPVPAVTRMFGSVPSYMSGSARILLGFNTRRVPTQTILNALTNFRDLELEGRRRYWWNRHEVLTIRLSRNLQRAREQRPHL